MSGEILRLIMMRLTSKESCFSFLEHWYVFALSISVCLIASYAYVWYTHPVYMMSTTVMADDDDNDISQSILDEVGVMGKREILKMKLQSLVLEV